jgi:uncharacterized membrane protein YeaQ/YmgE (transglycosylase-associated protein family)
LESADADLSLASRSVRRINLELGPIRGPFNPKQENQKPMNIVSLIIQIVSGAIGGNVAGAAMKESSLGTVGNSIAGILGGGLGGTILQAVMGSAAAGAGLWT